jgi:uncharacterized protein (TIGR04255 family)
MFKTCAKLVDRSSVPLDLPEPDGSLLPGSPLDLVVCQIRFENKPEISTPSTGLAVHEALGASSGPYPRLDQLRGQAVNVELGAEGLAGVRQTESESGWRFQSADGLWIVALMPGHLSLESKQYAGWADFAERLHALIDMLEEHISPKIEQRIGLRYVDRITEVDARTPRDWAAYLQEPILGFAVHEVLGNHLANARQQMAFDLGDSYGCLLTHGFLPRDDGRLDYLLDYDVFREGGRPFDAGAVRDAVEVLHSDASKLFQASISPALYDIFREES